MAKPSLRTRPVSILDSGMVWSTWSSLRRIVLPVLALAATLAFLPAAPKAAEKWVERTDCKLADDRFADGDSFALKWKDENGKEVERTYRLYGVDCPESDAADKVLEKRIQEQMDVFGTDRGPVLKFGKEAARFTERALKRGKVRIMTRGKLGQEVPKHPGRPQRRYAMVEVMDESGKPRWLHELLLENGLARAYGEEVAWPPKEEERHGEKAAAQDFRKTLDNLERLARSRKAGIWGAKTGA